MKFKVYEGPVSEPVTLEEAKAHLRVDYSDEDTYIGALIVAAREYCELILGRALMAQEILAVWDEEPGDAIELPRPPLISVSWVKFYDEDGVAHLVDPSEYLVDTVSEPGRIVLAEGGEWPDVSLQPANGVQVLFTAGYGDDASQIPARVRQAILLMVGHWFTHREAVSVGVGTAMSIPLGVDALLQVDRMIPA